MVKHPRIPKCAWGINILSVIVALVLLIDVVNAAQPLQLEWSSTHYGPDGPWQAIIVSVGGNETDVRIGSSNAGAQATVDLLPGSVWEVFALAPDVCNPYPNSRCGKGGFWTPNDDDTNPNNLIEISAGLTPLQWSGGDGNSFVAQAVSVAASNINGNQTVYNASLASVTNATITNPDGSKRGPELGFFSLGNTSPSQNFSLNTTEGTSISTEIVIAGLQASNIIPSYSFGLHYGSAALNYQGSLVLGGYDRSRLIGPLTTFNHDNSGSLNSLTLLDVGIGIETGGSPFNFPGTDQSGLLTRNTSEAGDIQVTIDPSTPYLVLPQKTCQKLSNYLPISFDKSLKYWVWQTSDPNYKKIINSPTYLSFTFPPSLGASDNAIIKVPIALLNLTLDEGITNKKTPYFPCLDLSNNDGNYVLGRAFLQAAFYGANLAQNQAWIAQAPGPGQPGNGEPGPVSSDVQALAATDPRPDPSSLNNDENAFSQSWAAYWTPLATPPATLLNSGSGGLSTGAKAGIGVGVAVGALALIAGALLFWLRRRRAANRDAAHERSSNEPMIQQEDHGYKGPSELAGGPDGTAYATYEADSGTIFT
ncbi:hypothetical protein NA57DRAFT_63082 [Rhizodiscina lignyota]|uniref:Peptidase A1 domain-containing protein n=1 Tax=Rhizodiscina lignyota TaxID=1504668 RepID=A0A9P4INA4_9PEZI|nr:hypothetical protein NA57DRAFT_63082 [Rhizodiscina lignyota]